MTLCNIKYIHIGDKVNKYLGFYELKSLNIPTVQWKQFTPESKLDDNLLWTLRVAVEKGNDLNLPRAVGIPARDAFEKGMQLLTQYEGIGIVLFYPYFIADKSGVLDISNHRIVIEAVEYDLWNLVTYGRKNVTIVLSEAGTEFTGDRDFLSENEMEALKDNIKVIKGRYRDMLNEGKSVLAEWSFAFNTDNGKKPIGEKYLVFYELRTVD